MGLDKGCSISFFLPKSVQGKSHTPTQKPTILEQLLYLFEGNPLTPHPPEIRQMARQVPRLETALPYSHLYTEQSKAAMMGTVFLVLFKE